MSHSKTQKMPVLFLGHGSPMNALKDNIYSQKWALLGKSLPTPKAILVISAHWMTQGTLVTAMPAPRTIHDFYGFPRELFDVEYTAPGDPQLAEGICQMITSPKIAKDLEWGLDHGTWSILIHMYPNANIPVIQLSFDLSQPFQSHFELGQKLRPLRERGVLILGSGNIVHNLRRISWDTHAAPTAWASEFDQWVKEKALTKNFNDLIFKATDSEAGRLSIPTPDHYIPLLYILGATDSDDSLYFDIEDIQNASISMRSFRFESLS